MKTLWRTSLARTIKIAHSCSLIWTRWSSLCTHSKMISKKGTSGRWKTWQQWKMTFAKPWRKLPPLEQSSQEMMKEWKLSVLTQCNLRKQSSRLAHSNIKEEVAHLSLCKKMSYHHSIQIMLTQEGNRRYPFHPWPFTWSTIINNSHLNRIQTDHHQAHPIEPSAQGETSLHSINSIRLGALSIIKTLAGALKGPDKIASAQFKEA